MAVTELKPYNGRLCRGRTKPGYRGEASRIIARTRLLLAGFPEPVRNTTRDELRSMLDGAAADASQRWRSALAELVATKKMKDAGNCIEAEYRSRREVAWLAAREALA